MPSFTNLFRCLSLLLLIALTNCAKEAQPEIVCRLDSYRFVGTTDRNFNMLYDDQQRLTSINEYVGGEINSRITLEYNEQNQLIKEESWSVDTAFNNSFPFYKLEAEYEHEKLVEIKFYLSTFDIQNMPFALYYITHNTYANDGLLSKTETYNSNGKLSSQSEVLEKADGNILRTRTLAYNGDETVRRILDREFNYNETEQFHLPLLSKLRSPLTNAMAGFSKNNVILTAIETLDPEGNLLRYQSNRREYEYDEVGRVINVRDLSEINYTYECIEL